MVKKKYSLDLEEEFFWKAKEYGAKNKVKRGFVGVVELALMELIPCLDKKNLEVGAPHIIKEEIK